MPKAYGERDKKVALGIYQRHGPSVAHEVTGISRGRIIKWAREEGVSPPQRTNKSSQDPRTNYSKARRIELNNMMFNMLEDQLLDLETEANKRTKAIALRALSVSYAVLTDKRRLEEGRAGDGGGLPALEAGESEKVLASGSDKVRQLMPGKRVVKKQHVDDSAEDDDSAAV